MENETLLVLPRDIKFKISKNYPKYWFNGSAIKTIHANTLTSSIPFGERFFVSCVLPHIKKLKNRTQKRNALNFAKQEINHSKEHYRFYLKLVKPHYPKLKVKNYLYQKIFAVIAVLVGSKIRLAMVAAMEHFTAVSGDLYLRHPELLEGLDDNIKMLWQWHFIEEIEHKAVAFDIFHDSGGNYIQRVIGFFLSAFFLSMGFASYYFHMVCYDKLYKSKQFYIDTYQFFWGKHGLIKRLVIPYLRYLLPRFHPNQYSHFEQLTQLSNELMEIDRQLKEKYKAVEIS
ncbi:MAG: metal-dependent hydrolase [Gammaproteobacteria bacterium]|jgi:predicted metal-dependent hydrolase|nr:metal-dependent hydrolase [Gammaproteobacteria bacterium]